MSSIALENLNSPADRVYVLEPRDHNTVSTDIHAKSTDSTTSLTSRRLLSQVHQVPRSLASLSLNFTAALLPHPVNLELLWGLLSLNIKVNRLNLFLEPGLGSG
jgi:hypothetical protein